jgi:hypothetical protein
MDTAVKEKVNVKTVMNRYDLFLSFSDKDSIHLSGADISPALYLHQTLF